MTRCDSNGQCLVLLDKTQGCTSALPLLDPRCLQGCARLTSPFMLHPPGPREAAVPGSCSVFSPKAAPNPAPTQPASGPAQPPAAFTLLELKC